MDLVYLDDQCNLVFLENPSVLLHRLNLAVLEDHVDLAGLADLVYLDDQCNLVFLENLAGLQNLEHQLELHLDDLVALENLDDPAVLGNLEHLLYLVFL